MSKLKKRNSKKRKVVRKNRQADLAKIIDNLPSMIGYWDKNLINLHANSAYSNFFGKTPKQILGKHIKELLGPTIYAANLPYIEAVLKGEAQTFERNIPSPVHNGYKHTLAKYIPDIVKGKVRGFFVNVTDITEIHDRESKTNLVFETMNEGMVVHNNHGQVIQYNQSALKILGLTADQLLGKTSMDPLWKATRADGTPLRGEEHPSSIALKTGKKVVGTLMGVHIQDRPIRWVQVNATPYLNKDSERQVLVTFADLTETVQNKNQIDDIFSASLDLICIANTDGYFKRVNPSFKNILGYTEKELLSEKFLNFIHPDDVEATMKVVENLAKGVLLLNFENRYRCKSGEYRLISWHCQPNTQTGDLFAIGRDITETRKTEEGFKQVLTALNETAIVAYTDAAGTITEVNDNFCKISGYSKEELIGKNHRILNSKTHKNEFFAKMWKTISSGQSWTGDIQNRRKNGELYWVRTVITPLIGSDKKVSRYVAIRFDITAEKEAEHKGAEVSRLLDVVLQNVPSMIFVKDYTKGLRFSLFNKAGEELLGLKQSELVGKSDYDLFPKEQADFFTQKDKAVFESHSILKIAQEEISTPKGKRILSTQKVPIYEENGSPHLLIGISNDITEEIKAKEAFDLERTKSLRSAKLASLGEMSAGIAHEINNPVTIILGTVRLLPKFANDPDKLKAKVETIEKASNRIAKIVSGLKKFSRSSDKNEHKLHSLGAILNESLILTESKAKKYFTPIAVDCRTDKQVLCDEVEMEQIFVNMINNSVDAVKNLPEKWIRVSIFEERGAVVLQIRDSGSGVPESVQKKLFQPFFTTKPVGEGTGLGLSIVKGILDEHKATIELLSHERHTCFEIRFPIVAEEFKNAA